MAQSKPKRKKKPNHLRPSRYSPRKRAIGRRIRRKKKELKEKQWKVMIYWAIGLILIFCMLVLILKIFQLERQLDSEFDNQRQLKSSHQLKL
jgi:hypothetical protein